MNVKVPEALYRKLDGKLDEYGVEEREFSWHTYVEINLARVSAPKVKRLLSLVQPHTDIRGVATLVKDLQTWIKATSGDKTAKARTVEQFCALARKLLASVPGHRIYRKHEHAAVMVPYYVDSVRYHPKTTDRGSVYPAHVTMVLFWKEFGKRFCMTQIFEAEHCLRTTAETALQNLGYFVETDDLRAQHIAELARHDELTGKIGLQVWGEGFGTDNLDGNDRKNRNGWRYGTTLFRLDKDGDPTRMVVDVFQEDPEESDVGDTKRGVDMWFWKNRATNLDDPERETPAGAADKDPETGKARQDLPQEDAEEEPEIEIPMHPMIACFDMRRHMRLRVHVSYLTVHQYDTKLSERLVLPAETRDIVEMLVSSSGVFRDVVRGKGNGVVVLCSGPPGVGKTLTAEVYSETTRRPLYSVQCSQLGTNAEELEAALMQVFLRAQRWNAILLLDEADVYIAARGSDLTQNAIVGVFLRVLEYYSGVLFLTTNRSDLVDDAIASRCVARISYQIPTPEEQLKIWRILSDGAGIRLSDDTASQIVAAFPRLSGRDVKNLLKLSHTVSEMRGKPIDLDMIRFAKRFKPTADTEPS